LAEQVAIIGDGQMGLVLAHVLAAQGVGVRLWGFFAEEVDELARTRRSLSRLPELVLPDEVEVTADDGALFESSGRTFPTTFPLPASRRASRTRRCFGRHR
jgi:glycerol-3-phosphate dehydrogenase